MWRRHPRFESWHAHSLLLHATTSHTATHSNHCTTGWIPSLLIHYAIPGAPEPCPMKLTRESATLLPTSPLTSRAFCSYSNAENRPQAKSGGRSTREASGLRVDGRESLGTTACRKPSPPFRTWGHWPYSHDLCMSTRTSLDEEPVRLASSMSQPLSYHGSSWLYRYSVTSSRARVHADRSHSVRKVG